MSEDGGPAFPVSEDRDYCIPPSAGMSLRDYFAASAMQGLLAAYSGHTILIPSAFASRSYALADSMLTERSANIADLYQKSANESNKRMFEDDSSRNEIIPQRL